MPVRIRKTATVNEIIAHTLNCFTCTHAGTRIQCCTLGRTIQAAVRRGQSVAKTT